MSENTDCILHFICTVDDIILLMERIPLGHRRASTGSFQQLVYHDGGLLKPVGSQMPCLIVGRSEAKQIAGPALPALF